MYTTLACTHDNAKTEALFATSADCRFVVAIVKFSFGVHTPQIRNVVNLGDPDDLDDLVQKSGRACRDGQLARAIAYVAASVLKKAAMLAERG